MFLWDVELGDFPKGSLLQKDLVSYAKKMGRKAVVELEMKFPKDYPMNPPFVRILRPRFQFLTGTVHLEGGNGRHDAPHLNDPIPHTIFCTRSIN